MLRRALVMLRRALVMLRRSPPLETRARQGFPGVRPPFTFFLLFYYQTWPVDKPLSGAKRRDLTHRPHRYAVGGKERQTPAPAQR